MRVAFFSNFLNHHQLPFCQAMEKLTTGNFTFVATERIPKERLDMGYEDMNSSYPFVLRTYDNPEAEKQAEKLALESDVIITGSAPEKYTQMRIEEDKITFRYSERVYKKGVWHSLSPRARRNMYLLHARYKDGPLYMLCASAYTAFDYGLHGAYIGKTFKWGYFPEVKVYDVDDLMNRKLSATTAGWKHPKASILWAGRLIGLKHPDASIKTAYELKKKGHAFQLDIIGNGEMEQQLRNMIDRMGLSDCVNMLGAMSPARVREHMEKADIFLFTSDKNEGWGAVLNESMNSGCAVVASDAIGSVPFLIENGENGVVYHSGNQKELNRAVLTLIENPLLRKKLGAAAYRTLKDTWNAEVAAERLLCLTKALEREQRVCKLYDSGPCSLAERKINGRNGTADAPK